MDKEKAKEAIEALRQHFMDELDEASSARNFDRVDDLQNGRTALSVLERIVGA